MNKKPWGPKTSSVIWK